MTQFVELWRLQCERAREDNLSLRARLLFWQFAAFLLAVCLGVVVWITANQ